MLRECSDPEALEKMEACDEVDLRPGNRMTFGNEADRRSRPWHPTKKFIAVVAADA